MVEVLVNKKWLKTMSVEWCVDEKNVIIRKKVIEITRKTLGFSGDISTAMNYEYGLLKSLT